MVNIIVTGCAGTMGKVLVNLISTHDKCNVIAGFDINCQEKYNFNVYNNPNDCKDKADVIIDFSHPDAIDSLLDYCKTTNTPIVICTTGFSKEKIDKIIEFSKFLPIFFSFNMSLGINLLCSLSQKVAKILSKDFDIEIIEKHHNKKIDNPSGTAFMIANSINSVVQEKYGYLYGRSESPRKRLKNEIGIHSVRGGTIVGEHEVIFSGHDEILSISHTALSKEIFAKGAINAALFLKNKAPGLYNMSSII